MTRRAVAWLALGSAVYGSAQDGGPLRVNTRLVEIPMVAEGPAAPQLTKDDLRVFDNGKAQVVAFLRAARRDGSKTAVGAAPGVFSNRVEGLDGGVNIILLDALNTPLDQHAAAKADVVKCLEQLDRPGALAVYALGSGQLRILHDFTDDPVHLRQVVAAYRTAPYAGMELNPARSGLVANPATAGTNLDRMAAEANQWMSDAYTGQRAQLTLEALEAIARRIRQVPGRKGLIWVSGSFPMSVLSPGRGRRSMDGAMARTTRALNEASVVIYPVHTGGLAIAPVSAETDRSARAVRRGAAELAVRPQGIEAMNTMAEATGGVAYSRTNDLAAAIGKAMADGASGYTTGFYVSEDRLDGKPHELRVETSVKGVRLRYRRAYLADRFDALQEDTRVEELKAALMSPMPWSGVGMAVTAQPSGATTLYRVTFDLRTIQLQESGGKRKGVVELTLAAQGADGRLLGDASSSIGLDLDEGQYRAMEKSGVMVEKAFTLPPGTYRVKALALDLQSGMVGSVIIPSGGK